MPLVRHMIAPLAFIALLAGCGDIQYAGSPNDCGTAQARLAQLGINANDIERIEIQNERGEEGAILQRYAWAKMKSCDGYVVVRTSAGCGISGSQPYTTGNCRIPEKRGA